MADKPLSEEDFNADEMALMAYIYEKGLYSSEGAAEALGWTEEWVEHNAELLRQKGVLKTFAGQCRVYRVFFRGGACDGLEAEMAVADQEERIIFTLSCSIQDEENLLLGERDRELPAGMGPNGSINVLIGKAIDENTAAIYAYCVDPNTKPRSAGMDLRFDRIIATGTTIQMQALINAQKTRMQ